MKKNNFKIAVFAGDGIGQEIMKEALKILKRAEGSELTSGRGPAGIAAAGLYVAALLNNEKKTQREVADVAGITEVTIRNRYKELLDKLDLQEKLKIKEAETKLEKAKRDQRGKEFTV